MALDILYVFRNWNVLQNHVIIISELITDYIFK